MAQEVVEQVDGGGVRGPLELVERDDARTPGRLKGADQEGGARMGAPEFGIPVAERRENVDARRVEGVRKVG